MASERTSALMPIALFYRFHEFLLISVYFQLYLWARSARLLTFFRKKVSFASTKAD
jgi:NADH:ubiquinone oxidoreductase subunit 4 (subunit M)